MPRDCYRFIRFNLLVSPKTLCEALEILKELNTSKKRKVPEFAPMDFIISKWLKHVLKEDGIDRHYYEFSVWTELCYHLRSGDIWVPGSKQYKNFDEYLIPVANWEEIKRKQQIPLSIATNVEAYIQNRCGLMQEQLTIVNLLIRNQELAGVSVWGGHIQIPSLKMDVPDDVAN